DNRASHSKLGVAWLGAFVGKSANGIEGMTARQRVPAANGIRAGSQHSMHIAGRIRCPAYGVTNMNGQDVRAEKIISVGNKVSRPLGRTCHQQNAGGQPSRSRMN